MKHLFTLILTLLLFTACGESERMQFEQLQQIDSIAEVNADSAVALINAINRDSLSGDNNKYYYDLLKIRTNDKAYIAHTSDSAILLVIDYFENNDFNNLLPVAYYYGGRVYSDLGDAPQAIEYFLKALECENINTHTQTVVYTQIAGIYCKQEAYDLATHAYKKAIELNRKNNNTVGTLYGLKGLATNYFKQRNYDSALIVFNQCLKRAEEIDHTKLITSIKQELAEVYIFKKEYQKALSIINSVKHQFYREDSASTVNTLAHLYYRLGEYDSTIYYSDKLIKCKNPRSRRNGYNILANLYLNNNEVEKAVNPIIESQLLNDTIINLETPHEIRKLSSIYNYQIRERENNKLKKEVQKNRYKIYALCSSIIIVIVTALIVIVFIRKRKRIIKLKLQNVEMLLKQSSDFSESTIAKNKEKISLLEKQIESINSDNTSLIQELEQQKKLLELNNEKANIFKIQKDNAIIAFNNDAFIIELHNRLKNYPESKNIISEKEWEIITKKITLLFPSFINTLHELPFKLSLYEFRISILLKTKFTPKEIARLTNHTDASVSMTRARLHKKLTNSNSHASDWDKFINSL